jgi:tetratricopeptide (TPR) repeat protein
MKNLTLLLILIITNITLAQSYKDYFNRNLTNNERIQLKNQIHNLSIKIRNNPKQAKLYLNRGVVYSKLGYHSDAIQDYNRALKLDSLIPEAYFNRGISRARFRFTQASCSDIKKAYTLGLQQAKTVYNKQCKMFENKLGKLD